MCTRWSTCLRNLLRLYTNVMEACTHILGTMPSHNITTCAKHANKKKQEVDTCPQTPVESPCVWYLLDHINNFRFPIDSRRAKNYKKMQARVCGRPQACLPNSTNILAAPLARSMSKAPRVTILRLGPRSAAVQSTVHMLDHIHLQAIERTHSLRASQPLHNTIFVEDVCTTW
jgi:hypothetical protein